MKYRHLPAFAGKCRYFILLAFVLLAGLNSLTGCSILPTPEIFPSVTPTLTITPTRTIQWFPSTATPTPGLPRQVMSPTPEQRQGLGEIVLQDAFSDATLWQTYESNSGTAGVSRGNLTLVAPEKVAANLVSLRRGVIPADFYMEINSSTGLCRGKDSYGLVFRSDGGAAQYRLIVSCDGFLRIERWRTAEIAVDQDWTPSTQIPQGGPQSLRLGVWMVGSEMRIFVNGAFQFAVRDPVLNGQQVGVFLRSTGANAASVSFSNLEVRAITNYQPSPVPSPTVYVSPTLTRMPTNKP
jgi:hypothetical protein